MIACTALGVAVARTHEPVSHRLAGAALRPERVAVGINLAALSYYSSEYPFVDAFKCSEPFLHQSRDRWEVDEPLELRQDGYPARLAAGRLAGSLMFRSVGTHYPAGDYVCLYDGDGDLSFGFAARVVSRAAGRIIVRVDPSDGGIYLKITRTNPANPVHDIRLIMPGFEKTYREQPFHPDFLERWRGFSVIRFMDWTRTNDSTTVDWADRCKVDDQTQAGPSGCAPEYIADLANTLDADPWICIPHRATDRYVSSLATMLRQRLEPNRTIYLEYSNETWNGLFDQEEHCRSNGLAAGLSANADTAGRRYYARRATEVFAVFARSFDAARTLRVLAVQNDNPAASREVLDSEGAWGTADALAIAPYFGTSLGNPARRSKVRELSVEQVLSAAREDVTRAMQNAAAHARLAHSRDLRLLAYEAGPHLAGYDGVENDDVVTRLFEEANRSAAMGEIYSRYLQLWKALGGGVFAAFNSTQRYSRWGSWGLCEDYGPESWRAPKYRALRAFLEQESESASPGQR